MNGDSCTSTAQPSAGSYVLDSRTGRLGQVMDHFGGLLQLRPPGGGREWDCPPEAVRHAGTLDELRARVTELNRQTRMP